MKNVKPHNFSWVDLLPPGDDERSLVLRGLSKLPNEVGENGVDGVVGIINDRGESGDSGDNVNFALIGLLG